MNVKIDGLEELERKLLSMGQDFAAKSLVAGAYSSAKSLQDSARNNILGSGAYDTGLLWKSIQRKKIVYDASGTVVVITGVSNSVKGTDKKGKKRIPSKYAHIVHLHKPFMLEAYKESKQQVVDDFVSVLKDKIKNHVG